MGKQREKKHMPAHAGGPSNLLVDHATTIGLFMALMILTLLSAGSVSTAGMLGVLLCTAGLRLRSVKVDLWIFLPLLAYNMISMISSWVMYRNILFSYGAVQMLLPLMYLLMVSLDRREYRLLRRLYAVWTGIAALHGIGQFAWFALTTGARRLSGLLNNPNGMGIFLVVGWFGLLNVLREEDGRSGWAVWLRRLEPVLLLALSLTLSMGSFLSLAVGIAVLVLREERTWSGRFRFACRILARATLCMGTGVLAYLAASRTNMPWTCLLMLAYGGVLTARWPKLLDVLEDWPGMTAAVSAGGALVAGAAVLARPSSLATFAERLAMMRNGLRYLFQSPLLGVGAYQWRWLNLYDDDKYFNTNHIHNVLLHVGVETGLIAMILLLVTAVRFWRKKTPPEQKGGLAAFFLHSMIDTAFFYPGAAGLVFLTMDDPRQGGRTIGTGTLRLLLGMLTLLFAYAAVCGKGVFV